MTVGTYLSWIYDNDRKWWIHIYLLWGSYAISILRELFTRQFGRPGETKFPHQGLASLPGSVTQRPAWLDNAGKNWAFGGMDWTQEQLECRRTLGLHQREILVDFQTRSVRSCVIQKIGKSCLIVRQVFTQRYRDWITCWWRCCPWCWIGCSGW